MDPGHCSHATIFKHFHATTIYTWVDIVDNVCRRSENIQFEFANFLLVCLGVNGLEVRVFLMFILVDKLKYSNVYYKSVFRIHVKIIFESKAI